MIGTFQGHEGASIRGACVPVTFSFSRRKSHALAERKKNPRRCASEIGRHVPYNARTHTHTHTGYYANFPVASFFSFSPFQTESQLSLFSLLLEIMGRPALQ